MRVTQMNSLSPKKLPERMSAEVAPVSHMAGSVSYNIKEIFSRFDKDDYILLGLIVVLIFEGCDDYILLAALGYLFFMGLK